MPYGSFANIVFDVVDTPAALTVAEKSILPQHPRIESKPVLQWTAHELRKISLTLRYHWAQPERGNDPERSMQEWMTLLNEHKAHQLLMPAGEGGRVYPYTYSRLGIYDGFYVVEKIDHTVLQQDVVGTIIFSQIKVDLLEVVGVEGAAADGGLLGFLGGIFSTPGFFGRLF